MKRLLTPLIGTTMYAMGKSLTGGRSYVLVSETDSYANNLVLNRKLSALAVGDNMILLPDSANQKTLDEIVVEKKAASPWNPKEESYEQYLANCYIFAAEAYTKELEGVDPDQVEEEKPKTRRNAKAAESADPSATTTE